MVLVPEEVYKEDIAIHNSVEKYFAKVIKS
jgi:hypothetical protein